MDNKIKLFSTDSYFYAFEILKQKLKGKTGGVTGKNLIFCDEKISLMTERHVCDAYGGSFNTDVYSFGNYLRVKKKNIRALSKEGSSMAIRRILSRLSLKKFNSAKNNLAPTLYELIMQLKSAKITPEEILDASKETEGILGFKLNDVYEVYSEYEKFLKEFSFEDQSSSLSYLPSIILEDKDMVDTDVYLLGFTGWTKQARSIIETLNLKAKSVTAILIKGENNGLFVNETVDSFINICQKQGIFVQENHIPSPYGKESQILVDNLFNPDYYKFQKIKTENIFLRSEPNISKEAEYVAKVIKRLIMDGKCRYSSVTVALPDVEKYRDAINSAFSQLEIPFFLDEQKKADNHPLINLIIAYIDVMRKGFAQDAFLRFIKNPLVIEDKVFADEFENYIIKYNLNYKRLLSPFTLGLDESLFSEYEEFRNRIVKYFEKFDIKKLLKDLDVEKKLVDFSSKLIDASETIESAINDRVYEEVNKILDEIDLILGGVKISLDELRKVFISGVSALKLSIIPQYNDAVFVGSMKETALAKAKYLFVLGLDQSVPAVSDSVALISDDDIDRLKLKMLIEPKIKIVNDRVKENTALSLCAFSDKLFLSYPLTAIDGSKNTRSEILKTIERLFDVNKLTFSDRYLTKKQGLKSFAEDVEKFTAGNLEEFVTPTAYYYTGDRSDVTKILDGANKQLKVRLLDLDGKVIGGYTSPTVIEDYFECPYKAFLTHSVRLKERIAGKIDSRSAGTFFHAVLCEYLKRVKEVSDRSSSDAIVQDLVNSLIVSDDYKKFLSEPEDNEFLKRVIEEVKGYCFKTYTWLNRSEFVPTYLEAKIGEDKNSDLKEVSLNGGDVKIKGQIDRIDYYGDYARIMDYKSGSVSIKDSDLFTGKKLQLYLYAKAVKDKKLAGVYYLPISDGYAPEEDKILPSAKGKTLSDESIIKAHDVNTTEGKSDFIGVDLTKKKLSGCISEDALLSYVDYAVKVSEKAVSQMNEGVIAPMPLENVCDYCAYKGMCDNEERLFRTTLKVDEEVIVKSVEVSDED